MRMKSVMAGEYTAAELLKAMEGKVVAKSAFVGRFQRRDVDGLLELYEPEAAFVPQPGQVLTGIAAIREALNRK